MDDLNVKNQSAVKQFVPTPPRPPRKTERGFLGTIRHRCFNSVGNGLLTLCVATVLFYLVKHVLDWAVFNAVFSADNRRQCMDVSPEGACWAGVISWFNGLIYGRFPLEEQWRVNVGVLLGLVWLLPLISKRLPLRNFILLSWIGLYPFVGAYLFLGGRFGAELGLIHGAMASLALAFLGILYANWVLSALGKKGLNELFVPLLSRFVQRRLQLLSLVAVWLLVALVMVFGLSQMSLTPVPIDRWGGLFLTFIIAGFAITMAIPIGVVLALGRRSKLPVIHWLSMAVIELVRSVPLITVLFMAVTLLPIFLPADMEFNKLTQVLVAVCLFAGAYMAENIRGGLQAIPKGQYEAAATLGLGYLHTMVLVILPQALRMMIPNIMTSFISLLKDTTLVSIIGLFDIMLMARNIANDKDWVGMHTEPLVMISVLFFVLCYGMSQYSLNLEKRLKVDR
ncbi:amino acid ABC transporter permease [Marinomonas sp. M1K-6]|uniref:Amino acid ABC transporter permease n=1 Tax=Marinomonas profundi TaxID=2726122 RepID=A0A847R295_9GAMM|nr:amino acid ABC transporter permease [Marinomonas profundi]NLQ17951.1 amino acid ABC transporter permease [Marinomonas profundi]UDV01677.1 amino acid ABC transporter permease [Marinomonas profundi]